MVKYEQRQTTRSRFASKSFARTCWLPVCFHGPTKPAVIGMISVGLLVGANWTLVEVGFVCILDWCMDKEAKIKKLIMSMIAFDQALSTSPSNILPAVLDYLIDYRLSASTTLYLTHYSSLRERPLRGHQPACDGRH